MFAAPRPPPPVPAEHGCAAAKDADVVQPGRAAEAEAGRREASGHGDWAATAAAAAPKKRAARSGADSERAGGAELGAGALELEAACAEALHPPPMAAPALPARILAPKTSALRAAARPREPAKAAAVGAPGAEGGGPPPPLMPC